MAQGKESRIGRRGPLPGSRQGGNLIMSDDPYLDNDQFNRYLNATDKCDNLNKKK